MKIGNIISDSELINHDVIPYVNYYDYNCLDNIDFSMPTLFVGWISLKTTFTDSVFNILEKTIKKNHHLWEFNFDENKASHVKGVEDFVNDLPKYYFEHTYSYDNIDPVFSNIKPSDDIRLHFDNYYDAIYNYKNEFLYLLKDNKITGIDLRMFNYFKFDIVYIISHLEKRTSKYTLDIDGEIKISLSKLLPNFLNLRRYLVVL